MSNVESNSIIILVVSTLMFWESGFIKKISEVLGKQGQDWTFRVIILHEGKDIGTQILVPTQVYHSYSSEMLKKIMCLKLKVGITTN